MNDLDHLRAVPLPTEAEVLRRKALEMAYAYGVPFYINDGRINQHPPGERIEPPASAKPSIHNLPGGNVTTS